MGNQPSFGAIPDVTLKAGAPLWLPLDGYDPNGDLLTYSAVSSSPSVVAAEIPQGNRSLKGDVKSWGVMTFELFDNLVPQITNHIADLASSGFYDANATTGQATKIDQVVRSDALTMFRTGDSSGTGIGTSPLGSVDDQFAAVLQHTSSGLLSLYRSDGDDSGDSQFMVLGAPARSC